MSRIRKGDLVIFKVGNTEWKHLCNQTGLVITKPKEKPFRLTPGIVSLEIVVDVLVGEKLYENVRISALDKKRIL